MELWKDIKGFEGLYQVSTWGNVRSIDRKVLVDNRFYRRYKSQNLKPANCKGYHFVALSKNDVQYLIQVHRLVAEAFISNPSNKPEVNHKDTNTLNNSFTNLEWVTSKENKERSRELKKQFSTVRV